MTARARDEHDANCALPTTHHGPCGDGTRIYRAPADADVTWIAFPTEPEPVRACMERALARGKYVQTVMADRLAPREDP